MKRYLLLLFFILCLYATASRAQVQPVRGTRILLVLDGSYSMSQDWKDKGTKYKDASDFILALMDEAYKHDSSIEFALRVYGHQYPARYRQCYDSKQEVHFSRDNKQQMMMRLESVQPKGVASVSYSVKESIYNINFRERYEYIMVIITDGGESCEGNFCESLETLKKHAPVTTHVLHLADVKEPRLSCANYYYMATDRSIEAHAIENILQKYKGGTSGPAQPVPTMERLAPTPRRPQPESLLSTPAPPAPVTKPASSVPTQATTSTPTPAADTLGFGVLSLTGLDSVEIKDLQVEEKGRYKHYERYNSGMQPKGPKMVHKLKPGNYKLLYRKGVDQIWQKFFTIKDGQLTEVKL